MAWTASDADGDDLLSVVEYSADGGASWIPLVVNTADTRASYSADGLPAGANGVVHVTTTDGLNTASDAVRNLALPGNRWPEVAIHAPLPAAVFKQDAEIIFIATAYDMEDGDIPEDNVRWAVSRGSHLVTGAGWVFTVLSAQMGGAYGRELPPGDYTVSVTATDSQGAATTSHIPISVVPR